MRVTIAAIGAAVCYAGTAAGSDPLMYAGAFAALCAVRTPAGTTSEKGGERGPTSLPERSPRSAPSALWPELLRRKEANDE